MRAVLEEEPKHGKAPARGLPLASANHDADDDDLVARKMILMSPDIILASPTIIPESPGMIFLSPETILLPPETTFVSPRMILLSPKMIFLSPKIVAGRGPVVSVPRGAGYYRHRAGGAAPGEDLPSVREVRVKPGPR